MSTTQSERCPKCGAILLARTPGGQCVHCLLSLAADLSDEDTVRPVNETAAPLGPRIHYFGDYALLEEIGRGGMGKVWKARQISLNRIVALKMIHAGRFAGPDEVARFRQEAEAAASLDHPNIVPLYEVGEHESQHYFTMKFIAGETLASRISRFCEENELSARTSSAFDIRHSTLLISKIARAVHHAHRRGIMHRDLKPANILLDANDEPHLTDFGLARLIDGSVNLTGTGGFLGSLGYMAPEQAVGRPKDLTIAIDIYALGCVLYELLTGKTPHHAETLGEAIHRQANEAITPPRRVNPHVDRDLETICLKCLERKPERRYGTAAALGEDLERWLGGEPITARPVGPIERSLKWTKRHPLKLALASAIVVAIALPLLVAGYYFFRELPYRATIHTIIDDDLDGVFTLRIFDPKDERCTLNFTHNRITQPEGRDLRLIFTNVPPEWLARLRVQVHADQAGRPDPARSPILTNGQAFHLKVGSFFDRAFYCAEVGWAASNLLAVAPDAKILLVPAGQRATRSPAHSSP